MKVSLFIPCFIDRFYPQVGMAIVEVLERCGCEVDVPEGQTCCGQPAFNSGYWDEARSVAEHSLNVFAKSEVIVSASGSCGAMMKVFFPELFKGTPRYEESLKLGDKVYEFSSFLVNVLNVTDVGARFDAKVSFHDGCHGLRELGVKAEPRQLLSHVKGLSLIEMKDGETCCGFGGTFAVKFPAISTAMGEVKCTNLHETGADYLISNDSSCLMHLQGLIDRQAKDKKDGSTKAVKCLHLAEVLVKK
jgi:L-lactate dehydrogenase complex protein LldE